MELPKPTVLIVDDRPENLFALEKLLATMNVAVVSANSGNEALAAMLEHQVAVVLLDVQMPEMDGFETATLMRGNSDTRDIPIIFVTAISMDEQFVFKGYESGAVDYLFKPLDPSVLKAKVRVFLDLFEKRMQLEMLNDALQQANNKILAQQEGVVRQERLKALLQLAGATAHELNQPLMALIGNIDLLTMGSDEAQSKRYIDRIQIAGNRIATIVKKIQAIRHDTVKPYGEDDSIIDIEQPRLGLWVASAPRNPALTPETVGSDQPMEWHSISQLADAKELDRYPLVVVGDGISDMDFDRWLTANSVLNATVVIRLGHAPETQVVIEPVADVPGQWFVRAHSDPDALSRAIELGLAVKGGIGPVDTFGGRSPRPEDLLEDVDEQVAMEVVRGLFDTMKISGTRFALARISLGVEGPGSSTAPTGEALTEAALCLRNHIREGDQAFRIGGNGFALALTGVETSKAGEICRRYLEALSLRTSTTGTPLYLIGRCGIADAVTANNAQALWNSAEDALATALRQPAGAIVDSGALPAIRI